MFRKNDCKPPAAHVDGDSSIRLDERHRLAREMHDTTSQTLVVLQLQLGRLRRCDVRHAEPLIQELEETIRQIRDSIRGLDLD